MITYYLKDSLRTREQMRREEEGKVRKDGGDVFYPSWEDLKKEDREEDPAIVFTIKDGSGAVVARFTGPASAGIHRATWDLQYPGVTLGGGRFTPSGPLVAPGTYSVSMMKYYEGEFTPLPGEQSFEVKPLGEYALQPQDRAATLAFEKKVGELFRVAMGANSAAGEAANRIDAIKRALQQTPGASVELMQQARAMELELMDIREELNGDPTKPRRSEAGPTSIRDRLSTAYGGVNGQTYGPTVTHRRQFEIAAEQFSELLPRLRKLIEVDLPGLEAKLEEIGAPYTPGRKIPDYREQ